MHRKTWRAAAGSTSCAVQAHNTLDDGARFNVFPSDEMTAQQ
jgi:hypothetical protein